MGDGNCLCRAISYLLFGTDAYHLHIRAAIVIEGILNKEKYLSHTFLCRGASRIEENLPVQYAKYSDHYVSGQKVTENTVHYMYSRELHDCAKINSFMGLWQLAQAASALNTVVKSVYPHGGDPIMREDFNRVFFPVNGSNNYDANCPALIIMWTSVTKNSVPVHFVPLVQRNSKYDHMKLIQIVWMLVE